MKKSIMPKFTVDIPDDLLASARVAAAKSGVSLNAIICTLLEGFVKNESGPLTGNHEIIFRYSIGKITAKQTMHELHLDSDEQLRIVTVQSGLPLPRLSLRETAAMEKNVENMIDRFGSSTSTLL